jgi:hypothetical protein
MNMGEGSTRREEGRWGKVPLSVVAGDCGVVECKLGLAERHT